MQKGDTYINLVKTNDNVNPDKVLQHPQYTSFLKFFRSWAGEMQSCFERVKNCASYIMLVIVFLSAIVLYIGYIHKFKLYAKRGYI